MKSHLLVVLAAGTLGGCAAAPQPATGFTHTVISMVQKVSVGARPSAAQAAPVRTEIGDERFRAEYAMALTGDRDAMLEIAKMFGRGSNGVAQDDRAMVEWLRHASQHHHAGASYQLYLHYLDRGLDRDAVRYEGLALRQGYVLPMRLDPRRG
jgi:TPR repeat protein